MSNVKFIINNISIIGVGLALAMFVYAQSTFTGPVSAPPNGNTGAPLNVTRTSQTKDGGLGIGQSLHVVGIYSQGDPANPKLGLTLACKAGEGLFGAVSSGGIITGGTCGGSSAGGVIVSMYSTTYSGVNCTGAVYAGGGSCPAGTQTMSTACFPTYCISSSNCIPGTKIFYCVKP